MTAERAARLLVFSLILGVPVGVMVARWAGTARSPGSTIEIHGRMPENGGWAPNTLVIPVGETLHLRLASDDVMHSFAVGQMDVPPVDLYPGEVAETTITFNRPGKYVFYCTRWCGPNHWRMRGTIEVEGTADTADVDAPPIYLSLNLELDVPHPATAVPDRIPSARRGAALEIVIPDRYLSNEYYRTHSPSDSWHALRAESTLRHLSDSEVWDLVARVWEWSTTPTALDEGKRLYAINCAACHGESGAGDGVMARAFGLATPRDSQYRIESPVAFTDPTTMLGASPALLQGKVMRGGMGTGMPNWGPIFSEPQVWAIIDYLWSFQFEGHGVPGSPQQPPVRSGRNFISLGSP